MATFYIDITEEAFIPDQIEVVANDQICFQWKGEGSSVEIQTARYAADGTLAGHPLFTSGAGDNGFTYTVSAGRAFKVAPVGSSEFHIYLRRIGGIVKGSVNVKKSTGELDDAPVGDHST